MYIGELAFELILAAEHAHTGGIMQLGEGDAVQRAVGLDAHGDRERAVIGVAARDADHTASVVAQHGFVDDALAVIGAVRVFAQSADGGIQRVVM